MGFRDGSLLAAADRYQARRPRFDMQSSGISAGAGLEYFIAPKWALGGSFKWTTGQFNRVQFDNVSVEGFELDATSARFNLGFSWYPIRGGR